MADLPDLTPNELHAKGDETNLRPEPTEEAIGALEALAAEASKGKTAPPLLDDAAAAAKASAEKVASAAKTPVAEPTEAEKAAAAAAKPSEPTEAEVAAAEAANVEAARVEAERKAAEAAANSAPADGFDDIELPPNTKSKSAEAFGRLKQAAREKVAEVISQLTEAATREKKLAEELAAARAATGKLDPAIEQELQQLRAEHLALDVKNDPEFKKFDTTLQSNVELIYKKLGEGGLTAENIAKIKELGGPDAIDWEPILSKLPVQTRRFIEATLVDNERVRDAKEKALKNAETNAVEYTKNRSQRELDAVKNTALGLVKTIEWTQLKEVPTGATAEQKAEIDASNKTAQEAMTRLNEYLATRSPERYAELAVGTLLAYRFKAQLQAVLTEREASTKASTEQVASLTKERDALKARLEAIKQAQLPRNRGDAIISPKPVKAASFETSGAESLESLAKEVALSRDE